MWRLQRPHCKSPQLACGAILAVTVPCQRRAVHSWDVLFQTPAGALKTLGANKDQPLPVQLFDISDVVLLDPSTETVRK